MEGIIPAIYHCEERSSLLLNGILSSKNPILLSGDCFVGKITLLAMTYKK
jgi:hypothetical protein